jgi:hypothetical protein
LEIDRLPTYDEIIPDMRSVTGTTPEEVYGKRAAFAAAFPQRAEFAALYGALTNAQFVDTLLARYGPTSVTAPRPGRARRRRDRRNSRETISSTGSTP